MSANHVGDSADAAKRVPSGSTTNVSGHAPPGLWNPSASSQEVEEWIIPAGPPRVIEIDPGMSRRRPSAPMTPTSSRAARRGSVAAALDVAMDETHMSTAREHLRDGMLAPGTLRTKNSLRKTWATLCQVRNLPVLPLTTASMVEISSILKLAAFRSGPAYLNEMRTAHIRGGFAWSDVLDQTMKDCKRSLTRGIGPPSRAELRLEWMPEIVVDPANAEEPSWPAMRGAVWTVGLRFLLREVELSCIGFTSEEIKLDNVTKTAALKLAASKTDPQAKGVTRTLACDCAGRTDDPKYRCCPYHMMMALVEHQSRRLSISLEEGRRSDFPLIGTMEDPTHFISKEAMIAAMRHDIKHLKNMGLVDDTVDVV